jgi:hypothetical protein
MRLSWSHARTDHIRARSGESMMEHPLIYQSLIAYTICSGSIAVFGVALMAKVYFFPKPSKRDSPITLTPLGPDGAGIRSERYK